MNPPNPQLTLRGIHRQTPQRALLLQILEAAQGPLSAADILRIGRGEMPDLGLATIYRTLKILGQEEAVRVVNLPDGLPRFERVGLGQHHFQCRVCQRIWTLQNDPLRPLKSAQWSGEWLIEDHSSTFYGCCVGCKAKSPQPIKAAAIGR